MLKALRGLQPLAESDRNCWHVRVLMRQLLKLHGSRF